MLLACVESVPTVVHETVDSVLVASHLVGQDNWLDRAVLCVTVKRLEEQDSHVAVVTPASIPFILHFATRVSVNGSSDA